MNGNIPLIASAASAPAAFIHPCQPPQVDLAGEHELIENSQPRGFVWQVNKQRSRSASQFGPTISGGVDGPTCWVPAVGGGGGGTRSLTHTLKLLWQLKEHAFWTTLFFGMGAKLPAKLVAIEENRIIAATLSFICTPPKARTLKVCTSVKSMCKEQ